jgi:hypothetical protein
MRRVAANSVLKRAKSPVGILLVVNLLLLVLILLEVGRLTRTAARGPKHGQPLVQAGTVVPPAVRDLLAPHLHLATHSVALIFWPDSTPSRGDQYAFSLSRFDPHFGDPHRQILSVCARGEDCPTERLGTGSQQARLPFLYLPDRRGRLRRALGIGGWGTVILAWPAAVVAESYPYVLNPAVLSERLQGVRP